MRRCLASKAAVNLTDDEASLIAAKFCHEDAGPDPTGGGGVLGQRAALVNYIALARTVEDEASAAGAGAACGW